MKIMRVFITASIIAAMLLCGCGASVGSEPPSSMPQEAPSSPAASVPEAAPPQTESGLLPNGFSPEIFSVAGFDREGPGDFGYRTQLTDDELQALPDLLDLQSWQELSNTPEYGLTVHLSLADEDLERIMYVMDSGDGKAIIKLSARDTGESFIYSASEQCLNQAKELAAKLKDRAAAFSDTAVLADYIAFDPEQVTAFEQATVYQGPSVVESVTLLDGENAKAVAAMLAGYIVCQDETTPNRTAAGGSYQKYALWFGDEMLTVCYAGTFHLDSLDAAPVCHIDMEFYQNVGRDYYNSSPPPAPPDGIPMPGGSKTVIYDIVDGVRVERVNEEQAAEPEAPVADPFESDAEDEPPAASQPEQSAEEEQSGEPRDFWTIRAEMQQNAAAFKEINPDTVGWLYIYDTTIDSPVLQREGDNDYYLSYNDYQQYDKNGALFADFRDKFTGRDSQSLNLVLYGHSKDENPDGGVESSREFEHFTEIKRYQDKAFCEKNPYFLFATPDESMVFEVFAAFHTKTEFIYNSPNPSRPQQQAILDEALKKSLFDFGVDISPDDRIMTLSTCCRRIVPTYPNGYRFVVMGRLVEKGRLLEYERTVAENPTALTPDNIYE